jgi:hypothetical protein
MLLLAFFCCWGLTVADIPSVSGDSTVVVTPAVFNIYAVVDFYALFQVLMLVDNGLFLI